MIKSMGLNKENGFIKGRDGKELFYRLWIPPGEIQSRFLICHGFGEHSGRYDEVVETLRGFPIVFASLDLRGHGRSEGERVFVENFFEYSHDFEDFSGFIAQRFPNVKREFLLGHSMGGLIVLDYALSSTKGSRVLILSSPCLGVYSWIPFSDWVSLFLGALIPHAVLHNPVKPMFLTHDKNEARGYLTDPLIQRKITFSLAKEILLAARRIMKMAGEIENDILFLVAGADYVVKKGKIKRFFNQLPSINKNFIEFKGFYHEIFKEVSREKPFKELREFVAAYH